MNEPFHIILSLSCKNLQEMICAREILSLKKKAKILNKEAIHFPRSEEKGVDGYMPNNLL